MVNHGWSGVEILKYCAGQPGQDTRLAYVIYLFNSHNKPVSSVEAGMGMEWQIMSVEQCTFQMSSVAFLSPQNAPAGALLRTPLGSLQRCPDALTEV